MARAVVAVIALAVLAMVSVSAIQAGLEDAGQDIEVENETWTPNAGSVTTLDDSNREHAYYDENVTVYNATGVEMSDGDDYVWYPGNGTVEAVSGGDLDGDSSAMITYTYELTSGEQRDMAALLGLVPNALGLLLPGLVVVFLLAFLRG